ncbi:ribose ABC transporter permease [Spirochaetia bacterium]|nr:ribose ABC transporter permease [Spirochaetia bacterium]
MSVLESITRKPGLSKIANSKALQVMGPFLTIGIISLIFALSTPTFRTTSNLLSMCLAAAIYVVLAMGLSFVLIVGGTDLSAGSIVALSGMVSCLFMAKMGLNIMASVSLGILTGVMCGVINGLLSTRLGLIPFIATLGTQWVYRGMTNILGNGMPVSVRTSPVKEMADQFYIMGGGRVLGIPVPVYIFVFCALVLSFLLSKTVFGRNVYAIGSNSEAARLSGIKVFKTQMFAYAICGGMSGLAGVMLAARLTSAQTNAGTGYEFEGIFAAVIGGVSLAGGEGSIMGAVIGAFVVAILRNGLNLNGVNTFWQQVILGIIIVVAVFIDVQRSKRQNRVRAMNS